MCYVGKATKIFIFIATAIVVTGLLLGFGLTHHVIHKTHQCSGDTCPPTPQLYPSNNPTPPTPNFNNSPGSPAAPPPPQSQSPPPPPNEDSGSTPNLPPPDPPASVPPPPPPPVVAAQSPVFSPPSSVAPGPVNS
ncbi:hypothetical protein LguiA_022670 [Lonicera macranthoides]